MMIRFARPSPLRALLCIAAVTVFACVVAGIALYTAAIVTHADPKPTAIGEYVRLFVVDITIWGPIALLTVWQMSVPAIVAIGMLVACIRDGASPSGDDGESETAADSTQP
jgi:hypothetical protein